MQLFLPGELARVLESRLEIVPGLDKPGAEALHRPVLLDAVAMGCHDRRRDPEPRGGERDALPVIAGGREQLAAARGKADFSVHTRTPINANRHRTGRRASSPKILLL